MRKLLVALTNNRVDANHMTNTQLLIYNTLNNLGFIGLAVMIMLIISTYI